MIGVPSNYAIDGVQYVAVLSGYGVDASFEQELLNAQSERPRIVPQGGVLWVFRLADASRSSGHHHRSPPFWLLGRRALLRRTVLDEHEQQGRHQEGRQEIAEGRRVVAGRVIDEPPYGCAEELER